MVVVLVALLWAPQLRAEEVVLSSFTTKYQTQGEHKNRAHNVELTAGKIDGTVVFPGDTFSYNQTVGERTAARGFLLAHVIKDKKLVDDWGGGACQLASTTHAAALYAGLEITESHAHSLASAYMQASLDSTVSWPNLDMKFRNNTQRPITIRAIAVEGLVTVQLITDRPSGRNVMIKIKVLKRKKKPTWTVKTSTIKSGSKVAQAGSDGYDVERHIRVSDFATGEVYFEQTRRFKFSPLARIVLVPED
jgi:vancomycin resistance protein YoaR